MSLDPQLSEVIGGYRLERVLGRGGMGTVFLGKHQLLGRLAAIKVLSSEFAGHEDLVSRFFHEAKVVNDVRHPNIVDVIDFVRIENPKRVAFVMEYLDGESLDRYLKTKGALTVTQSLNTLIQVVSGLQTVHAIGVIHRDLKPANLRFTRTEIGDCSNIPTIKILDFGIAKAGTAGVGHKTQTGLVLGTPGYMAPEQVSGDAVSPATDVYAIGEILYEFVTGQRLFEGTNTQLLRLKLAATPPVITLPAELPARRELVGLCRACLSGEPSERPTTDELLARMSELKLIAFDSGLQVPAGRSSVSDPSIRVAQSDPSIRVAQSDPAMRVTPSLRTHGPPRPTPAPLSKPTPAPVDEEPAEAAFDSIPGHTLSPAQSVYQPPPRSKSPIVAAIIGAVILMGGGLLLLLAQDPAITVHAQPIAEGPVAKLDPRLIDEPKAAVKKPPVEQPKDPLEKPAIEKPVEQPAIEKPVEKPVKPKVAETPKPSTTRPPPPPPPKAPPIETPPISPPAPAAQVGEIEISAWTTAGRRVPAKVEIDGKAIAKPAPLKIRAAAGTRRITIEAAGHPPKTREVVIEAGKTTKVDVVVDLK